LEYSGPYLAMLEYASSIKLTVFLLILGNLVGAGIFATVIIGSFALALFESTIAKMRFFRMQEYMSIAFFLALAGLILIFII